MANVMPVHRDGTKFGTVDSRLHKGTPGETYSTINNTISAIRSAGLTEGGVFFTTPYPGSRLFRWCQEQGFIPDVESFLLKISNRDASVLSFNFTPYPDIIVKMMYIMVQNGFFKNQKSLGKARSLVIRESFLKHWIVPMVFHAYFIARRGLSPVVPRYRNETITFELNSRGTVRLSSDLR